MFLKYQYAKRLTLFLILLLHEGFQILTQHQSYSYNASNIICWLSTSKQFLSSIWLMNICSTYLYRISGTLILPSLGGVGVWQWTVLHVVSDLMSMASRGLCCGGSIGAVWGECCWCRWLDEGCVAAFSAACTAAVWSCCCCCWCWYISVVMANWL